MNTTLDPIPSTPGARTNLADWRGVGDLISVTTERVSTPVEGMHRAIIDRWLDLAGPRLEPAKRLTEGLITSIYQTIRFGGSLVGSTVSTATDLVGDRVSLPPVWETARGRYVQSIFNGLYGDSLAADESPLGIDFGLRDMDGRPISNTRASLSRAFPNPTDRLAVVLHGFGETERSWVSDSGSTLIEGLEADGFSVLRPRYNTGRAIADNGSELSDLLEAVRLEWPVPVKELVLIGHSMGGLVVGRAVEAAHSSEHRWVDLATHLVAIGAPHLGSPIEKGVQALSMGLGRFKVTLPLNAFLEGRSAGIKDLRHGVDSRPEGIHYHVVAGAVTKKPGHLLGVLAGDLVVRVSSAIGRDGHREGESADVLVVGGRNHAALLHDPDVISQTREWLAPGEK